MVLLPQTVINVIIAGGSVRVSAKGLLPDTMRQYAIAAASSGATVEFACEGVILLPQTLVDIAVAGQRHVKFDFTSGN